MVSSGGQHHESVAPQDAESVAVEAVSPGGAGPAPSSAKLHAAGRSKGMHSLLCDDSCAIEDGAEPWQSSGGRARPDTPRDAAMPVSRAALAAMEAHFFPPPVEVLHELCFNAKLKLSGDTMRRLCGAGPAGSVASSPFWDALASEVCNASPKTEGLPLLCAAVDELREMLLHLYPRSEALADVVAGGLALDGRHVAACVLAGRADVAGLAATLAAVLKANCAPKRDLAVDEMAQCGVSGDWLGVVRAAAVLMELMAFDLLNYQLCSRRAELIANLVAVERMHFTTLDVNALAGVLRPYPGTAHDAALSAFVAAVAGTGPVAETLALDSRRVRDLHVYVRHLSSLGALMLLFAHWTRVSSSLCAPHVRAETKARLARALESPGAPVASELVLMVCHARAVRLSRRSRALLCSLAESVLSPAHRLHAVVLARVLGALHASLAGEPSVLGERIESLPDRALDEAACAAPGGERVPRSLAWVAEELSFVAGRMRELWAVHWRVHGPVYARAHALSRA